MLEFPPDYTLVVQVLSFFFMLFVLNKLLFVPFVQLLSERDERTEGATREAESARGDADRIRQEVETQLAAARAEAMAEAEAVRREARAEEAQIFEHAKSEATQTLGQMRAEIAVERDKAAEALRDQASSLARQMVDAILGAPTN